MKFGDLCYTVYGKSIIEAKVIHSEYNEENKLYNGYVYIDPKVQKSENLSGVVYAYSYPIDTYFGIFLTKNEAKNYIEESRDAFKKVMLKKLYNLKCELRNQKEEIERYEKLVSNSED